MNSDISYSIICRYVLHIDKQAVAAASRSMNILWEVRKVTHPLLRALTSFVYHSDLKKKGPSAVLDRTEILAS